MVLYDDVRPHNCFRWTGTHIKTRHIVAENMSNLPLNTAVTVTVLVVVIVLVVLDAVIVKYGLRVDCVRIKNFEYGLRINE